MVGIPGAGKTTYAKSVLGHAAYFGTDEIRKELFGKELRCGEGSVYMKCFTAKSTKRFRMAVMW